jgi:DNA-binding NarL/FixJ family response regulator
MAVPDKRILVCLVERNSLAAAQLRLILRRDPNLRISSEEDLSRILRSEAPQVSVLVLDEGTFAAPLDKYLHVFETRHSGTKVILLNEEWSKNNICRLLSKGADGFLRYCDVTECLPRAIRVVSEDHIWVEPEVLELYVRYSRRLARDGKAGGDGLTMREQDIVELVQRNLSNKEIGSKLSISPSTVKFHLARIFSKLGVRDRHLLASLRTSGVLSPLSL